MKEIISQEQVNAPKSLAEKVAYFYQKLNFKLAWVTKTPPRCLDLIEKHIRHADEEGLNPEKYVKPFDVLKKKDSLSLKEQALLDKEITQAILQFTSDAHGERFDPRQFHGSIKLQAYIPPYLEKLINAIQDNQLCAWVSDIVPKNEEYLLLKKALKFFKIVQEKHPSWYQIKRTELLKIGMRHEDVATLRRQLYALGFLKNLGKDPQEFDQEVQTSLIAFQKRHGLEETGVVGPQTLPFLNLSPEERIKKILVNLERWRWMPIEKGTKYVLINKASFRLLAIEDGLMKLDEPVIIGRIYQKTPTFIAPIISLTLNPNWTAPHSIASGSLLRKIKKDPSYLEKKGFIVYKRGTRDEVPLTSIDWSEISGRRFPFTLYQRKGAQNALGQVRINVDNSYRIFIHGTPSKKEFEKSVRTFSAGCVRMREPLKLASFLLANHKDWPKEKILATTQSGQTVTINLSNTVPAYFKYFTVWVNRDGNIYFYDDVYKHDHKLWEAIKESNS